MFIVWSPWVWFLGLAMVSSRVSAAELLNPEAQIWSSGRTDVPRSSAYIGSGSARALPVKVTASSPSGIMPGTVTAGTP